jgi:protein AFG1
VYYHPLDETNDLEINKIFASITSDDPLDPVLINRRLDIWGRSLLVPESTSKVAKFSFEELCGSPLSAADYLEVTHQFGTVFVLDVPKMGLDKKDMVNIFGIPRSLADIDLCVGTQVYHLH